MKTRWYKDSIFYQIYPRSFRDSNGDGVGDIRGIIEKLDYLKDLGVTAVWLSPCYKSPNDDNGYDISDYRDIMEEFGTLDDWKEMIEGMHKRGIRLIMDLVVNHTSDEHFWFQESKKSKDNPYRDYYIWRPGRGKDGKKPPNNWTSRFSGPAWEYDETTGEWYLHLFSKKQPDLNWDNPKVRQEVADICNYWLDLGVDGFRCDVIIYISKTEGLPDGKFNPITCGDEKFVIGPHYHEYIHELNKNSWSKYDIMTVGEGQGITVKDAESMVAEDREELDAIFTFEHQEADAFLHVVPRKFKLSRFKKILSSWQRIPDNCWNSLFLENHDYSRVIPRYGKLEHRKQVAKMLAVVMNFQKGTPYIYQGQEIGMTNIADFKREDYKDIVSINVYDFVKKLFPPLLPVVRWALQKRARDHARTPMQWSAGKYAGFSDVEPWMMVNPNYKEINVEEAQKDADSVLNFYKKLNRFRLGNEIIKCGSYNEFYPKSDDIFVYTREYQGKGYLVAASFRDKPTAFALPEELKKKASGFKLVMSNYDLDDSEKISDRFLKPYETFVYEYSYKE
jgi:oligo-1,6-glucosidase